MDVLLDALGHRTRQPHQEDVSTSSTDAHKELLADAFLRGNRLGQADCWIAPPLLLVRAIMNDMAYSDLRDMDRDFCEHGLTERRRNAAAIVNGLLIYPNGIAHFQGCHHKGNDPDYTR